MKITWTLLPICRIGGQKQMDLPGLAVFQPPGRCARSRREDALLVYLAVVGTAKVEDAVVRHMVSAAADTFYQTNGSVTAALRAAGSLLNHRLWALNQERPGQFVLGRAVIAAARGERLYFLVSGPVSIFAVSSTGMEQFSKDVRAGRGMGASQALPHSLSSLSLRAPMKIALCAHAPEEWKRLFESEQPTTPAAVIADSLWQMTDQDLHAVLVDIIALEGADAPLAGPDLPKPANHNEAVVASSQKTSAPLRWPPLSPERRQKLAAAALDRVQRWRGRLARWQTSLGKFAARLLPDADTTAFGRWMIILAVLLPLLVSGIAGGVYLQRGLRNQALALYQQADARAVQARMETNPVLQREAWRDVLMLLDQADGLMPLDESANLRKEALAALDALDNALRVPLENAHLKLPDAVAISALSAHADAAFLLDGDGGQVYRAARTATGYRLSPGFRCGAGRYDGGEIEHPVAVQALPAGMLGEVLVVDEDGDLLWCDIARQPIASRLPDTGRGALQISLARWQDGYLYVLDRNARAVWIFPAESDGRFLAPPLFFFDAEVPNLGDVRDMEIYGGDLYLLNGDGTLTTCSYSLISGVPNRCESAVVLEDPRPGYAPAPRVAGTNFTALLITRPTNSALWLMDGEQRELYRFSPQIRLLQNLLRPPYQSEADRASWSTFTITPDYVLLVASGNQLYFAAHIP